MRFSVSKKRSLPRRWLTVILSLCLLGGLFWIVESHMKPTLLTIAENRRIDWFLVDLPGYGYAKRAKENKSQWSRFIDEYIHKSPRLKLVCQLIDSRHPLMESDKEAYAWLLRGQAPIQVIATKTDKLSKAEVKKNTDIMKKGLQLEGNIVGYSALKGDGRDELLDVIARILVK